MIVSDLIFIADILCSINGNDIVPSNVAGGMYQAVLLMHLPLVYVCLCDVDFSPVHNTTQCVDADDVTIEHKSIPTYMGLFYPPPPPA